MGLFIAAGITTALALTGLFILLQNARAWRPPALAFVIAMLLQPLAFYAIRLPIDGFLRTTFAGAAWITIVALFYAPLIEEPAKWLTAAVPAVRRAICNDPVTLALAVGLGFGTGEIWFLAHALVQSPHYPDLPFWQFGGFMIERLAVCFLHGVFVVPPFYAFARGHSFLLGGLIGMAMHFFLNFPIYLAQSGAFGITPRTWPMLLVSWIFWMVFAGVWMIIVLAGRFKRLGPAARP